MRVVRAEDTAKMGATPRASVSGERSNGLSMLSVLIGMGIGAVAWHFAIRTGQSLSETKMQGQLALNALTAPIPEE